MNWDQHRRRTFFHLLIALYFLASQGTVLVLVSQWYSTAAHAAVDARSGNMQEKGELRWTPRIQLPLTHEVAVSDAEQTGSFRFPEFRAASLLAGPAFRNASSEEYYARLCNKAPPLI